MPEPFEILIPELGDQCVYPYFRNFSKEDISLVEAFVIYKVTYPWDHLAGVALVKKNGGVVSRWSGEDFLVPDVYEGLVVARNREVYDMVMREVVGPLLQMKEVVELKVLKG